MNSEYLTKVANKKGYLDGEITREWLHTFSGAFLSKYPKNSATLDRFRGLLGHIPTWEDITDINLKDLKDELLRVHCANTAHTELALFKAVLNENIDIIEFPSRRYAKILKCRKEDSQSIYITDEEIQKLDEYVPKDDAEAFVKKCFMIETLTGARNSDSERMTTENVNGNLLTYVQQKTKHKVTLPVYHLLTKYLNQKTKLTEYSNFNRKLKEICKNIGMTQQVTLFKAGRIQTLPKYMFAMSHTGRRTFCTRLAMKGCRLERISMMAGHLNGNQPNTEMTKKYIKEWKPIDDSVVQLFNDL